MEDIIVESHLPHASPSKTQTEYRLQAPIASHLDGGANRSLRSLTQPQAIFSRKRAHTAAFNISWGRSSSGRSMLTTVGCAGILILCPSLVIFLWIALEDFDGSLFASLSAFWLEDPVPFAAGFLSHFRIKACIGYATWLFFQAMLYTYLPCSTSFGQLTPAGNLLGYKTNGLVAWVITHVLAAAATVAGLLDPAILAQHWGELLVAANIYGFLVSAFSYMKALLAPTHPEDRKFSGQKHLVDLG